MGKQVERRLASVMITCPARRKQEPDGRAMPVCLDPSGPL
jgi:hypothetical protein